MFTTPEEKVQGMIRQAENAKARIFSTPGNKNTAQDFELNGNLLSPSAVIDEGYFVVGAHLDENTINKIGKGEYVNFGKLLPKDKVTAEEDGNRLEMIVKNGKMFWVPAANIV